MYGNHEVFGDNYQISNNQENFAAVMYDYCAMLNEGGLLPDTTAEIAITASPQIELQVNRNFTCTPVFSKCCQSILPFLSAI
jgi:hypothetical protein